MDRITCKNTRKKIQNSIGKEERPSILVSACLLGICCKYNGEHNYTAAVEKLREKYALVPVCPEQLGGLTTPRSPSEIRGAGVFSREGADVTGQYLRGAGETLKIARLFQCTCAVLKSGSPSCGQGEVYDGTFSGKKIPGDGITVQMLKENGIQVFSEKEILAAKERNGRLV